MLRSRRLVPPPLARKFSGSALRLFSAMESQLKEIRGDEANVPDKDPGTSAGGGIQDIYGEDSASVERLVTPWSRNVASGVELLRDPRYNKGLGFTEGERDHHYLRGLLPPVHFSQDLQEERVLEDLRSYPDSLQKYVSLMELQERNERLFYKVLIDHVEEMLPFVYTPTVGEACQKYGLIYRRPRGLYISLNERGKILDCLRNWPEHNVHVIVVTDGERILGLGDLGIQGMGIPVGKLALYTALGGLRPSLCLPVVIDVGTNNKELLNDRFYIGLRRERATGEEYDSLIDEFMTVVKKEYGERVLVQFEDFANHNAFRLLAKYSTSHLTFNDDIQGTAAVVLAGLIAAVNITGTKISDHTYLFAGAGEAGTGIAEIIALHLSKESNIKLEDARKNIWMVDSKGLLESSRADSLQAYKKTYAHEFKPLPDFPAAVKELKPSVLIGTTSKKGMFSKEVLEAVASFTERPIVLALSNPTSKSECTAEEAIKYTQGRAIFASGSPFSPVEFNGKTLTPGQANNAYIFPGMGLGCVIAGSIRVKDDMFLEAARALAHQVSPEDADRGLIYPPFSKIRSISAHIGAAVAAKAYELGLATRLPQPKDLLSYAQSCMYNPKYRQYR